MFVCDVIIGDVCVLVVFECAGCETNEEQYECVPGKPQGRVDVPPYSNAVAGSVTEDWDSGMIVLLSCLAIVAVTKVCNELECGPVPNVMAALPNIGSALCSTPL